MPEHDKVDCNGFAGKLLVAHPGLQDPNFARTGVLLSAHSPADGAVGVVVNRPLGRTLASLKPDFVGTPLQDVPLYEGGPVGHGEIILTAWQCMDGENSLQMHFGSSADHAEELKLENPAADIRGFLGYSGWGGGQLEEELRQDSWVLSSPVGALLDPAPERRLWKLILRQVRPQLAYLADAPEDPSVN